MMYDNKATLDLISHLKKDYQPTGTIVATSDPKQRKPRFGFNTLGNVIPVSNPGGRNVTMIAAMDAQNGIGKNNQMPWAISPDMKQFKRLTTGHTVIMGHNTWKSLGSKALPNRVNVVITHDLAAFYKVLDPQYLGETVAMPSLEHALDAVAEEEQVFIIGGAGIYTQALELGIVNDMILTRFTHDAQCDTHFPDFNRQNWLPPSYSTHQLSGGVSMRYEYWRRRQLE